MKTSAFLSLCLFLGAAQSQNETPEHWMRMGRNDIDRVLQIEQNWNMPRNMILMVGDGLGLSTITAGRIYKGQKMGMAGEEYKLSFETFPSVALSKTYNQNHQVPDSAGTANAMLSGIKTNFGNLGVTADVQYGPNCDTYDEKFKLKTVLDFALEEGKSVGLVTTTRITHATPAASFAHTPFRDWESDVSMQDAQGCEKVKDIAYQLVMDNPNINVILGGGKRSFENRNDGLDLVQEWRDDKARRGLSHAYVGNTMELESVDTSNVDYLMGLFSSSHMSYEIERDTSPTGQPSLEVMAQKAIEVLSKNPRGFFLLVEGGRIDHAHHDNFAKKALEDLDAFDNAVRAVTEKTNSMETLTVVTADHSHVFSQAGYPTRGNNVLGTVDKIYPGDAPTDGLPYLTLGYLNGPVSERVDYTNVDTTANDFRQPGCVEMPWETHSAEDVGIFAHGPMSHMFHSTHEQSYIGHIFMYASCLGPYKDDCNMDMRYMKMHGSSSDCRDQGNSAYLPSSSTSFILLFASVVTLTVYHH